MVTELFSYILYVTSTILIGYAIIPLVFDTPCLNNNWVFQKNNWVNTPKKQLICFSEILNTCLCDDQIYGWRDMNNS